MNATKSLQNSLNRRYRARLGEAYLAEQLEHAERNIANWILLATEREIVFQAHRLRRLLFEDSFGLPLFDGDPLDMSSADIAEELLFERANTTL